MNTEQKFQAKIQEIMDTINKSPYQFGEGNRAVTSDKYELVLRKVAEKCGNLNAMVEMLFRQIKNNIQKYPETYNETYKDLFTEEEITNLSQSLRR